MADEEAQKKWIDCTQDGMDECALHFRSKNFCNKIARTFFEIK